MNQLISLVQASPQDFTYLSQLHKLVMYDHVSRVVGWDETIQLQRLKKNFRTEATRLIFHGGTKIGTVAFAFSPEDDCFVIRHFYIQASYQRQGIGKEVLSRLIYEAKEQDRPIRLSVLKGSPAIRLYEKSGFIRYRGSEWEDFYQLRQEAGKASQT